MNKPSVLVDAGWPTMGYTRYNKDDTQILASVYGPYESRFGQKSDSGKAIIDVVLSDCLFYTDTSAQEAALKSLFTTIVDIEKYPYMSIMINFQVLARGSQILASCMNAGLGALKAANLELKTEYLAKEFLVENTSVTLAIVPKTDSILFSLCSNAIDFEIYKKCVEELHKESLNTR